MRVIIIGCGRVGARTAAELDQRGDQVTVIDLDNRAFNRLPQTFAGVTVRGNGTAEDIQRGAGAEMADLVMALTEGDNRNALAAQMAKHTFGVPRVVAKINDPLRAEAFRSLGLETICRTVLLSDALIKAAHDGAESTDGAVQPPTAEPLRGAPAPGSRANQALHHEGHHSEERQQLAEDAGGTTSVSSSDVPAPSDAATHEPTTEQEA